MDASCSFPPRANCDVHANISLLKVYEPECFNLAEEDMDEIFGDTTEEEFCLETFISEEMFILEVGGGLCVYG